MVIVFFGVHISGLNKNVLPAGSRATYLFSRFRVVQGAAAISVESLGGCCDPGNENIVGNSSLTCSPGGKNHISVSQRPPLAKMWRQEQFR